MNAIFWNFKTGEWCPECDEGTVELVSHEYETNHDYYRCTKCTWES